MNYSVSNFEDNLLGCFKFVSLSNEICQMRSSRTPHKFLYEGAAESWNSDWFWTKNFSGFSKITVSDFVHDQRSFPIIPKETDA